MVDAIFYICAAAAIAGALGVIASRSPIGSVLSLLGTFFALAVIYLLAGFQFLAAVQILVYGGAIMVLFLFVIMLLGVDRAEDLGIEPIVGQRPMAAVVGVSLAGLLATVLLVAVDGLTGARGGTPLGDAGDNTRRLGEALFTDMVFAVELTAILLTVAVVGAVALARRLNGPMQPLPVVAIAEADDQPEDVDDDPAEATGDGS